MRDVVFQGLYVVGQSQINRGAKDRRSRVMSFTKGEAQLVTKKNLKHWDLRNMKVGQKIYNNRGTI